MSGSANNWVQATLDCALCLFLRQRPSAPDPERWARSSTMKVLILLFLSSASLFAGETVLPLKSGETNMVSYGLSCLVSDSGAASNAPAGSNLILVLRNTGAKWIDFAAITADDFSLQNAKGQDMKFYLWTIPRGAGYGDATVVHLVVDHAGDTPRPWSLRLKSKPHAHVPFEIVITGIEPLEAQAAKHSAILTLYRRLETGMTSNEVRAILGPPIYFMVYDPEPDLTYRGYFGTNWERKPSPIESPDSPADISVTLKDGRLVEKRCNYQRISDEARKVLGIRTPGSSE